MSGINLIYGKHKCLSVRFQQTRAQFDVHEVSLLLKHADAEIANFLVKYEHIKVNKGLDIGLIM